MLSAQAGTPLAEIEALVDSKGQQLAFEPMDYGAAARRASRRRHDRRRAGRESVRAAPHQGRRRARSLPRRHGGVGPRRDLQVRRPRGEERHRLRSLQAAGGLVRHAGGDDRRDDQDAAASPRPKRPCWSPASTMRAAIRSDDRGDGVVVRRVGRRASAGRIRAAFRWAAAMQGVPRLSARRRRAVGRASQGRRSPPLLKPFG